MAKAATKQKQPKVTQKVVALPPEKTEQSDEVIFQVIDTTATNVPRTHVMLDGKRQRQFTFPNDQDSVSVPYRFAIQFAKIPAFIVEDGNGRRIKLIQAERGRGAEMQLNKDECVARYDELLIDALIERANKAGGNFVRTDGKNKMIVFLRDMAGLQIVDDEDTEEVIAELDEDGQEASFDGSNKGALDLNEENVTVKTVDDENQPVENEVDFNIP